MPFQLKAAPSSRVRKPAGTQGARTKSLSPFSRFPRAKPFIQRSPASKHHQQQPLVEQDDTLSDVVDDSRRYRGSPDLLAGVDAPLPDVGPSHYVADTTRVSSVIQAIQYVQNTMFADIPDARAGMNSTRIAHVLHFRRSLPPIVSVAHVHVLLNAPTKVEREIVDLIQAARVRRLLIPGRGASAAGLGDCLVLMEDWEALVRNSAGLEESLKEKFIEILRSNTKTAAVSAGFFSPEESSSLVRAGFLVSASSLAKETTINPALSSPSADTADQTDPGAEGQTVAPDGSFRDKTMFLSLPNMGPYLRLLGAARSHLGALLQKSCYGEAPLSLLKDRWDGAVESDSGVSAAKRLRGEFSGVLPGRTKKWKDLYGLNFRWALEEALGAGLIELFDTGAVGPGVRRL
ncbi:hypothetical protein VTO42DRAFT_3778 [Malbranchea cinnamomea]